MKHTVCYITIYNISCLKCQADTFCAFVEWAYSFSCQGLKADTIMSPWTAGPQEPLCTATHHHTQPHHCVCCGNLQLSWIHNLQWAFNIDFIIKKRLSWGCRFQFYNAIIHFVLCTSIIACFGSANKQRQKRIRWKVRTTDKKIIVVNMLYNQDL